MDETEFKIIRNSLVVRIFVSFLFSVGCITLSHYDCFALGVAPSAILAFAFAFGIGAKFFPDSSGILTVRFKNYLRSQKGLPLLSEDDAPLGKYFEDFRRG